MQRQKEKQPLLTQSKSNRVQSKKEPIAVQAAAPSAPPSDDDKDDKDDIENKPQNASTRIRPPTRRSPTPSLTMPQRLHITIWENDPEKLKKLLISKECTKEVLATPDSEGNTILHIAVMNQQVDQVHDILETHPEVEAFLTTLRNNEQKSIWDIALQKNMCDALTLHFVEDVKAAIAKEQKELTANPECVESKLMGGFLGAVRSLPLKMIPPDQLRLVQKTVQDVGLASRDPVNVFHCSETLLEVKRSNRSWARTILGAACAVACLAFCVFCVGFGLACAGLPVSFITTLGIIAHESPMGAVLSLGFGAPCLMTGASISSIFAFDNVAPKRTIARIDRSVANMAPPTIVR